MFLEARALLTDLVCNICADESTRELEVRLMLYGIWYSDVHNIISQCEGSQGGSQD
jgi:hypothetical protein